MHPERIYIYIYIRFLFYFFFYFYYLLIAREWIVNSVLALRNMTNFASLSLSRSYSEKSSWEFVCRIEKELLTLLSEYLYIYDI